MADQIDGSSSSKKKGAVAYENVNEATYVDSVRKVDASSNGASSAADQLRQLHLQTLINGMASDSNGEPPPDMAKHKFWQTQPVPHFDDKDSKPEALEDGPIHPIISVDQVRQEPYPLIDGFSWVTMDITDSTQLNDLYTLLFQNYVEDTSSMFRFNYSSTFLTWALRSPGWRSDWHVGIRATASQKLVAFISGVPATMRVRGQTMVCAEINFLCVHKKLRDKRLTPMLIREITRRVNLQNIWQAVFTAGVLLPTPVSTCRYYHRALDWPKLNDAGFSPLPQGSTKTRQILRNKLPERTVLKGLRLMEDKDVESVRDLLQRYLNTMDLAQVFTTEEIRHWLLNPGVKVQDRVVHSYVVEDAKTKKITDFFSFYCIESTILGNEKPKSLKVAYLYYYASEAAFDAENGSEKKVLKKRLNELVFDALILAKKDNFDVMNALTLLDNPLFLEEQKFGAGDGRLHYNLYNWRTPLIGGGINKNALPDTSQMGGVGIVML